MNKKELSEQEIRTRYITPAITASGWQFAQIREEYTFTAGRIEVVGNHARRSPDRKRVDYLLHYTPDLPLAVVEAKDNNQGPSDGMQQALDYAALLDVPFVYTSNGDCFVEHDRTAAAGVAERTLALDAFPPPAELWACYNRGQGMPPGAADALHQLFAELAQRGVKVGIATSVREATWDAAMIYPHNNNLACALSELQRQQLALFA